MTRKQCSILFGALAIVFIIVTIFIDPFSDIDWLFSVLVLSVLCALVSIFVLPKERRGQQSIGMILGLFISFFVIVIMLPGGNGSTKARTCILNIKQLTLANLMYAADNNDTLPLADKWRDASAQYIQPEMDVLQQKPFKRELKCPIATSPWHYAMNDKAAGFQLEGKQDEIFDDRVMLFEADAQLPNASGGIEWFVFRHADDKRGMIGFMDGHARSIPKERVAAFDWNLNKENIK